MDQTESVAIEKLKARVAAYRHIAEGLVEAMGVANSPTEFFRLMRQSDQHMNTLNNLVENLKRAKAGKQPIPEPKTKRSRRRMSLAEFI